MSLIEDIKYEEGFSGLVYECTEGFDTIGYGTKLPISTDEAELLLNYRLDKSKSNLKAVLYKLEIKDEAWEILFNMAYQLGVPRLLGFKRMIKALEKQDYLEASEEMRDSLWYQQTRNRAKRLIKRMKDLA